MIRRGTTPTVNIKIKNIPMEYIKKAIVTFKQGNVILNIEPLIDGDDAICQLTQEQTLMFKTSVEVSVQIKVQLTNDKVVASKIKLTTINQILNEEVMI